MSKYHVNKEDAVLVIIDIQERLMNAMAERDQVYKNTALLVETARQFNIPVIVSEQYPRGLGSTVAEIKDHLEDYQYQLIEKTSFSVSDQLLEIMPPGRLPSRLSYPILPSASPHWIQMTFLIPAIWHPTP